MAKPKLPALALVLACGLALVTGAWAEDTVLVSTAADPEARLKRTGQIIDYTGDGLKLRTALGRDETIPAARVVEIESTWTEAHREAGAARLAGKLDEAIAAYRRATREERRPWARRRIMSELTGTYLEAGRIDSAGDEFLAILAADPATPYFDVVPIAWRPAAEDGVLQSRADQWLAQSQSPLARVLGASWLLAGPRRVQAIAAIDELTKSPDPRVASLARIQWWRTKLVAAKVDEISAWQEQLEQMPREVQATGWYVLGDHWARHDRPELAALAYLKPPLLFRSQRALAADALLAAGKQLEKMGQPGQAVGVYREAQRDFAHLPAAKEAGDRLAKLEPPTKAP